MLLSILFTLIVCFRKRNKSTICVGGGAPECIQGNTNKTKQKTNNKKQTKSKTNKINSTNMIANVFDPIKQIENQISYHYIMLPLAFSNISTQTYKIK